MVELLFPRTLSEDMRDGFVTQPSLGQAAGDEKKIKKFTFLNLLTYL